MLVFTRYTTSTPQFRDAGPLTPKHKYTVYGDDDRPL